jgi:hypothetical protein
MTVAEGDNYEGDLLKIVLTSDLNYWKENKDNWLTVCNLIDENTNLLKQTDTTHEIIKGWFDSYKEFKNVC